LFRRLSRFRDSEAPEGDASEEFKQKVAAWKKAGIFDEIAAKIDPAIEELDKEEVRS